MAAEQKRLRDKLKDKSDFIVLVELTGGVGFNIAPIEKFFKAYKEASSLGVDGFDFVGMLSPQNPGGTPNIDPTYVLSHLRANKLLGDLDFIPHVSCKDDNADATISWLVGLKAMGVEGLLALTGDKPVSGKGVFELESVGLLKMIEKMNLQAYVKANPEALDDVHQWFPGAVVSPFKYTESSQMQQYYKMEKKIACGAKFLITQVGWDCKKSVELLRYMKDNGLDTPVIGNVFFLSTASPAPRLMHDLKLPGCFVSDEFLAKLCSESVDEHIERAAQQVAMYKSIGAAGVDIGSVHDFPTVVQILQRAAEIGENWRQHEDNLCWPREDGFYLYDKAGHQVALSKPKKKFKHRMFDVMHNTFLTKDRTGYRFERKVMGALGARKGKGFVYDSFTALEGAMKRFLFQCEMCGDCYLPENFSLCTIGGCEKGMDNAPCGDSTAEGKCGNNLDIFCIGERIYDAAAATGDTEKLRATINEPRIHALDHTASILNFLFGKDHMADPPLTVIGEAISAWIPNTAKAVAQLGNLSSGDDSAPSGAMKYVRAAIESQALERAAYIAINLDALGKDDPKRPAEAMVEYVKLVRKWGRTVPVCIDSTDSSVLIAGLKEWYNTDETARPPLLSSAKSGTMKEVLPLRKEYEFAFVEALTGIDGSAGQDKPDRIDEWHPLAAQILERAVGKHGFKSQEVLFDLNVWPIAEDLAADDNMPGRTHRALKAIAKIKRDRRLRDIRLLMRPGNAGDGLPRKIGVCRAYVAKAAEYGLDGVFADATQQYGIVEPDEEILTLVDAFAKMDGSADAKQKAAALVDKFVQLNKKPAAKRK
ncbi:MAG: methylenetetrahydrofolate reductase C-terminal domain-containing protein [Phycisphaerales bacterium]|nr:MAG: methylenetetrahydrofolate reductase C-terminal domain-containing protein [Phycisphaerales bacterium]